MYKMLPTNTRPLKLKHSSEEFTQEWIRCIQDKTSDLSKIITMMRPVFKHWGQLLSAGTAKDDIGHTTLCRLLSPSSQEEALSKIKLWLQWIKANSDITSELQYIFLERMRKFRYTPTLASPIMVEYLIAKDFKLGIYHHIRYTLRLLAREALYHSEMEANLEIPTDGSQIDWLLLKNIETELTTWQSYLLFMIKQGYSSIKRSELTKIHRRNLHNEEKKIWHLIKQTL